MLVSTGFRIVRLCRSLTLRADELLIPSNPRNVTDGLTYMEHVRAVGLHLEAVLAALQVKKKFRSVGPLYAHDVHSLRVKSQWSTPNIFSLLDL